MGQEQFGRGNVWANARENGIWKDVPFLASNFAASVGMTITVIPSGVVVNRYCRVGNLVHWNLWIHSITLGGTAANQLIFTPPTPNMVARSQGTQYCWISDTSPTQLCSIAATPQQPPNFNAQVNMSPQPVRVFVLGSAVQVKFNITYEYGKSNLMP